MVIYVAIVLSRQLYQAGRKISSILRYSIYLESAQVNPNREHLSTLAITDMISWVQSLIHITVSYRIL